MLLLQIFSHLKSGIDQSVRHLPIHARYRLASALDRPDPDGRDWRALATSVGLADRVPASEQTDDPDRAGLSRLDALLEDWAATGSSGGATIKDLHRELVKLGRPDAVETLLSLAPLFKYVD